MQTWIFSRWGYFQTEISGVSGKQNMKCYISPEPEWDELSDSEVILYTSVNYFRLQEIFWSLHLLGKLWSFTVADELQLGVMMFHISVTSPAYFKMIWWFSFAVGAFIVFNNWAVLSFTAKQVETWRKSDFGPQYRFMMIWYLSMGYLIIVYVEIYQIFGDHLCWSGAG